MVQIKSVGVIGAGQMGTGIAHVVALGGYDVLLHDVSAERLEAGMGLIDDPGVSPDPQIFDQCVA